MNDDGPLVQRVAITVDLDYEPGYEHLAAAMFLEVMGRLAHHGAEPRWASLEVSGPTSTP